MMSDFKTIWLIGSCIHHTMLYCSALYMLLSCTRDFFTIFLIYNTVIPFKLPVACFARHSQASPTIDLLLFKYVMRITRLTVQVTGKAD